MKSPDFIPPVAPPLEQIDVISQRQDNRQVQQTEKAVAEVTNGVVATEQSLTPEAIRARNFQRKLGNIALGFDGDTEIANDPTIEAVNRREKLQLSVAKRVGERAKNAQVTKHRMDVSTGSEPFGKERKIVNKIDRMKIRVSGKDRDDKLAAIAQTKINPKQKQALYQKSVGRKVRTANTFSGSVGNLEEFSVEGTQQRLEQLKKDQGFERLGETFRKIDQETNQVTRDYNKDAKKTNSQRNKYVKRVTRAAKMDKAIDRAASSKFGGARPVRAATKGMSAVRGVNERLVQRAERKGADIRSSAKANRAKIDTVRANGEARKQEIIDYLKEETYPLSKAVEQLSYIDVLSDDEKAGYIAYTESSPNGMKYAAELQKLVLSEGEDKLSEVVTKAITKLKEGLAAIDLGSSRFGESKSWVLWDIAKQMYYVNNPGEADPSYTIANPLEDPAKMQEIIDRHVGWEIYTQFAKTPDADKPLFVYNHELDTDETMRILSIPPKPGVGLSSKDLAALGAEIRS